MADAKHHKWLTNTKNDKLIVPHSMRRKTLTVSPSESFESDDLTSLLKNE